MQARPTYQSALAAFRTPDAPKLVTRRLFKSTLAVTEIQGAANHGMTSSVPYDDAYLVQLRLRDCPRCVYFSEGREIRVANHGAGAIQFHDLRRDPVVELLDPFHIVHLYLPRKVLNGIAEEAGASPIDDLYLQPSDCFRDAIVENLFLLLMPALTSPEEANTLFVEHTTLALSAHVAQVYGGMRMTRPPVLGGLAPWQERRAKELLDADLSGDVSLGRLAVECGLSIRHFTRAFRQSVGIPPHRYLLKRRVEQARKLLADPALPLLDVALACGFADQSHFTRIFSASVGMSPGAWRRLRLSSRSGWPTPRASSDT